MTGSKASTILFNIPSALASTCAQTVTKVSLLQFSTDLKNKLHFENAI
jgi:hypothetical protein